MRDSFLRPPAVYRFEVRAGRNISAIARRASVFSEGDLGKTSHTRPAFGLKGVVNLEPFQESFTNNPRALRVVLGGVVV